MMKVFIILICVIAIRCDYLEFEQLKSYEGLIEHGVLNMMFQYYSNDDGYDASRCKADVITWKNSTTKLWAWEMLDATGKFPHGILRGNIYGFGQFDECLGVEDKDSNIKGKYCPVMLALPELGANDSVLPYSYYHMVNPSAKNGLEPSEELFLIWGVCLPNSCKIDEFKKVFLAKLESSNLTRSYVKTTDVYCSTNEPLEWSPLEISALIIFSIFGCIIFCSTLYDIIIKFYRKSTCSHAVLISFSIYTNTEKLMKINKSSNSLRCLNGIRVMSMFWVMLCHRYSNSSNNPLLNVLDALDWKDSYGAMMIVGGGVAVDSFFLLSGLLLAYIFCNQYEKKTSFNLALFYFHRFLRLWPAMAAAIYFYMSLYRHVTKSPAWPLMFDTNMAPCREYWWSNLIYLQNYINPTKMCMGHLWYLAIDTQLYVLSPILLIVLLRNKKFAVINMVFWLVVSQITVIAIVYTNSWGGILPTEENYWYAYYTATHTRAVVWLIGFIFGYIVYKTKTTQIQFDRIVVVILWITSLSIMLTIVYGVKTMNKPSHIVNHLEDSTFNAFSRTGWALALSWTIFACLKGYGGPINWFLSLEIWEILGKLTYSMYLLHVLIQTAQLGSAKSLAYFGHFDILYLYFGDIVITIFFSYLWCMAFESPFLAIEKALLYPSKKIKPLSNMMVDINSDIQILKAESSLGKN